MYHLKVNPDTLTDERWAEAFNQLLDIRRKEAEAGQAKKH